MFEPTITSTFENSGETAPLSGVSFGQATHPGRLRDENQDHLGAAPELGFFVVTDGVGGAPGGATAARLATAAMLYSLRNVPASDSSDTPSSKPRSTPESHDSRLVAATMSAHQMICDFAVNHKSPGAATTMAALWVAGDHAHVANCGDSRVYRLCGDRLEQLTKDHTMVQEHLDRHGPLGERWVRMLGNVVTSVLGGRNQRPPNIHLASRPIVQREVFLLCTDGLTKMVPESEIAIILGSARSPQHAASALVELANDAGGFDNVTCIVVQVEPRGGAISPRRS